MKTYLTDKQDILAFSWKDAEIVCKTLGLILLGEKIEEEASLEVEFIANKIRANIQKLKRSK